MRRMNIGRGCFRRPSLLRLAWPVITALFVLVCAAQTPAAEQIPVFPAAPYDGYIIYQSLALFWIAIIGLIVIIRMKLREIERTQAMGKDRDDDNAPLLE